jgi:NADPH:quinone reductase-like Zn-dependent oxidoreductase
MRAFAVQSFGEPASVHDLPVPAADDAVLIRVRFAGVNPLDNNLLGQLLLPRHLRETVMAVPGVRQD